jgi:hemerythrin HHE cation binding domain-containing protein
VAKRAATSKRGQKRGGRAQKVIARAKKKAVARKASKRKTAARAAATRSRTRKPAARPSRLSSAATLVRGAAAGAAAAIARRLPWARDENDPLVLLETDHRRFEALFKQGEETTERGVKIRTGLLETLTAELNVHELIEEKILYPALAPHAQAREIVLEGFQEHHVADLLLNELHSLARSDEQWGAKFKVLTESIEHHIQEEERQMFRIARAVLTRDELTDLGVRMKALKGEVEE